MVGCLPRTIKTDIPLKEMRTPAIVRKIAKEESNGRRLTYLTYLQEWKGQILFRTFATKKTKKYGFHLMEVIRELTGQKTMFRRLMYCSMMGGWQVEFDGELSEWISIDISERPGVTSHLVNPELVKQVERFKYCGWTEGTGGGLANYLHTWLDNPGVEYFGKLGIIPRKSLVARAAKDGNFRKFLRTLSPEDRLWANLYGANAIIMAYKNKEPIEVAARKQNEHLRCCRQMREYASPVIDAGWKPERISEYLESQRGIEGYSKGYTYRDYINACEFLHLDLHDTKVAFPNDLQRMHDLRVNERAAAVTREDRKKQRRLYKDFKNAADELKQFETVGAFEARGNRSPSLCRKEWIRCQNGREEEFHCIRPKSR